VLSEAPAAAAASREFVTAGANRTAWRDVMLIRVEKGAKTLVEMLRPEPAESYGRKLVTAAGLRRQLGLAARLG